MNVIDLRNLDERMAPLDFVLTPFEKSEAAVYRCQIERQRLDRNAADQAQGPRPAREQWRTILTVDTSTSVVNLPDEDGITRYAGPIL